MCTPLAIGPVIGTAVGVIGAVANQNAANNATAAEYAAKNNAIYWRNGLKAQDKLNADLSSRKAFNLNFLAAGRSAASYQRQYNEKADKIAFANQEDYIKLMSSMTQADKLITSGGTGRSARRAASLKEKELGIRQAARAASLRSARDEQRGKLDRLYGWGGDLAKKQREAWRGGNPQETIPYEDPSTYKARMRSPWLAALEPLAGGVSSGINLATKTYVSNAPRNT